MIAIHTKCQTCDKDIESERLELDLKICKDCAFAAAKPRYKFNNKVIKSLDLDFTNNPKLIN